MLVVDLLLRDSGGRRPDRRCSGPYEARFELTALQVVLHSNQEFLLLDDKVDALHPQREPGPENEASMTNGLPRIAFTAIAFALLSITAHAATQRYSAQLKASAVVPSANSVATGTFTATFDSETIAMTYTLKFEQLTGPAASAHIHGPADRGANALVVFPLGNNPVARLLVV